MPTFISSNGIWTPSKERVYDPKKDEIYEGPDRAALDMLKENDAKSLGMDSAKDPENIMRARQLGISVDELLERNVPPTPEALEKAEEAKNAVTTHAEPKRKKGVKPSKGGFGEIPVSLG